MSDDQHATDTALGFLVSKRSTSTDGGVLTLDFWQHGTKSKAGEPGTMWKATVRPDLQKAARRVFYIFTPCPGNSRNTAKALLGRHLRKETLGVRKATVREIEGGELKAASNA